MVGMSQEPYHNGAEVSGYNLHVLMDQEAASHSIVLFHHSSSGVLS